MWWNAIAGAAQGWVHGSATNALIKANNKIAKANADASNQVRTARNAETAAHNSLARWVQSVNNNRHLDAGGQALEANIMNYRRESDATMAQGFSQEIARAEQQGAAAAAQAVSGIEGNVVDMVNGSTALRDAIVRQQFNDFREYRRYDVARRAGNIMSQMIGGMDNSVIFDSLDYNKDVAMVTPTMSRLAYALRGAAEHMGGGGSIDSGYKQQQGQYTQEAARRTDGSIGVGTRLRSNSQYDLADHAYDTKYTFGFREQTPSDEYSPYSLYGGSGVKLGDQQSDSGSMYSLWSR